MLYIRKQRQYNFPELKTKFKISTGCGFKIDSHSQFEVSCGKDNIHSMPYDLPTSLALHKLRCIYHVIQAKNMGAAASLFLNTAQISYPSLFLKHAPTTSIASRTLAFLFVINKFPLLCAVARALYFSRLSGPSRTQSETVENMLLVNPPLYLKFR
eukprot:1352660-Amorphochlora_amoeboformis.AAC.1